MILLKKAFVMSYETHLLDEKKDKSWLSFIFKSVFFLCALFLIMITILANMGGNGDAWKGSLETFVSSAAGGKPSKVGILNQMRFFPRMGFDAENIDVFQDDKNLFPLITIKKVQMYIKFWNVAFGDSKFSHFYIEDFRALKGVIGLEEFWAERVFVDHDIEAKKSFLRANGKVGVHPWSMNAELEAFGSRGDYTFGFPETFTVRMELSDMRLEANVTRNEDAYLKIDDFKITKGDHEISGRFVLSSSGRNLLKVRGELLDAALVNGLQFDLLVDNARRPIKLMGGITSDEFSLVSLDEDNDFLSIYNRAREVFGYDKASVLSSGKGDALLGGYDLDLDFDIKNVDVMPDSREDISFSIIQEKGKYHIGAVSTVQDKMLIPPVASVFDNEDKPVFFKLKGAKDLEFIKRLSLDSMIFAQDSCVMIASVNEDGVALLPKESFDFMSSAFQGEYERSECKDRISLFEPEEKSTEYMEMEKVIEGAK